MLTGSIVTFHNNLKELDKVITSFLSASGENLLYISDNSNNRDIEAICHHPRIKYIYNNSNKGFGYAHNIALKLAIQEGSEFHVILNPDVYFDGEVIDKLLEYMNLNKDVGLVMPKVVYPSGELQRLCKLIPTPFNLIARRFLPDMIKNIINSDYEFGFSDYNKTMEVPILSGCFMFIRTEVLSSAGLFDENYFMYCEDFDLSRRINSFSKTIYYPDVKIVHAHAKESYKNIKMLLIHIKSAIYFFNKWGWLFDKERRNINKYILSIYKGNE